MPNLFIVSDHHLHHEGILGFLRPDGAKLRNFSGVNEMNEYMVQQHNNIVSIKDKVYFLGDVVMRPSSEKMNILNRFNGEKTLVIGNHDSPEMKLYSRYFKHIYSSRRLDQFLLTHIPIHPMTLGKAVANIHGHEHGQISLGPRYFDVSVECLGYRPIEFEVLKKKILKQLEDVNESGV